MKLKRKHCASLIDCIDDAYFIHYSCQSLSDDNEGYSPRVTSIAVMNHESKAIHSFSIHLVAERRRIDRSLIEGAYDKLELEMLQDFNDFVANRPEACFLHWNMTNINYGFEAIWHRYEVLSGQKAVRIREDKRFNLSRLLKRAYGDGAFECRHMMYKLMEVNGGQPRGILDGQQEVEAFREKQYVRMHMSTVAKVTWFREVFTSARNGKLKLNYSPCRHRFDQFFELRPVKALAFLGVPSLVVGTIVKLWFL